jgi:hypothetical protein
VSAIRLRSDGLVHGLVRGLAVGALGGCVVMLVLGVAAVVQTGQPAVIFVVVLGVLPAAAIGCIVGAVLGVAAALAIGLASALGVSTRRDRRAVAAPRGAREAWVWRLVFAGLLLAVAAVVAALEGLRNEWNLRAAAGDAASADTVLALTIVLAVLGLCCLLGAFAAGEWPTRLHVLERHPLTAVTVFVATVALATLALGATAALVTA